MYLPGFLKRFFAKSWFLQTLVELIPALPILFLLLKGYLIFPYDWDWLAYHLPFALKHYKITTFEPLIHLKPYYDGFPPLVHYLQGAFIKYTGIFTGGAFANSVALAMVVISLRLTRSRVHLSYLALMLLGVPLFLTHLSSGYIDLFVACSLAGSFVFTSELFDKPPHWRLVICISIAYFIAMASKYQAWPFVAILCAFSLLWLLRSSLPPNQKILRMLIIALAAGSFPISNLIRFGNPSHPIATPIIGRFLPDQPAPFRMEELCAQMPPGMCSMPVPMRFITSALELTRLSEGGIKYSVDQGIQLRPQSSHFRIGGWFFLTVILLFVALLTCFITVRSSRGRIVLLSVLSSPLFFTAANHELRYWLFLPVTACICVAHYSENLRRRHDAALKFGFLLCAMYVCWELREQFVIQSYRPPAAYAPPEAQQYWKSASKESTCVTGKVPYTIFWSGPTFNEYKVSACVLNSSP